MSLFCIFFIYVSLSRTAGWKVGPCDPGQSQGEPFCNTSLSFADRVANLLTYISVKEKVLLLDNSSPPVPTVRLPFYEWWSEALHGLAISPGVRFLEPTSNATSFPQPLVTAGSFNRTLFKSIGDAISTEARAFDNVQHAYLTFWTPNINIFRDPRWGRGQETPGEDPYLTSEYVAVYMHALQYGDDPNYLKMSGCCKHFVAYSFDNYNGTDRHHFNAVVTEQDLTDTYYPAFQSCVQRGEASSVMCSYNEVNGIPSCANYDLLTVKLRQQWGFDGYITSDCGAVDDIQENHNYTNTTDDTVRVALNAGMDLCCGPYLAEHGFQAYTDKAISEADIDAALTHQFTVQMRLGLWDPPANQIYKTIPVSAINTLAHQLLALDAARQGLVLLKNNGNILPLNPAQISKLAVIGPNGDMHWEMLGNYHGFPPFVISPLDGVRSYVPNGTSYIPGCTINGTNKDDFPQAIAAASAADATILVVGLDQTQERENHDRTSISLPGVQSDLISEVARAAKGPVVVVVVSGGAVDLSALKVNNNVDGLFWIGYAGQAGGQAIADAIFGAYSPAGRLPQTLYSSDFVNQINFADMNMRPNSTTKSPGRTYRFYAGTPVYEFGYGLSYTTFTFNWTNTSLESFYSFDLLAKKVKSQIYVNQHTRFFKQKFGAQKFLQGIKPLGTVSVNVTNTGNRTSDVSVLAFVIPPDAGQNGNPLRSLYGFEKINLGPGQSEVVTFTVTAWVLSLVSQLGERQPVRGSWNLEFKGDSNGRSQRVVIDVI